MGRVAFQLAFKTDELNSLALPIEIRRPNAALIERLLTTETVDLSAGQYYAVARMPAGQRLITPFEVKETPAAAPPLTVTLAPDPEDESPHEWEEVRHFLGRHNAGVSAPRAPVTRGRRPDSALESFPATGGFSMTGGKSKTASSRAPFVRVFMGNVVERTHVAVTAADVLVVQQSDADRVVQCDVHGRDALLIAQLVQPGGPVQNLALPVTATTRLQLVASREPSGTVRVDAYLPDSVANMLLQYSGAGLAATAEKATSAAAENAEKLLMQKMADPIGAAIGAYAILRLGSIEQLHDWTANLRQHFRWLPDGAAICGEHLARLGRFEEAFDAFLEVPRRGLPIFSDGLFYTIERMKLYCSDRIKTRGRIDAAAARAVVQQLEPFATLVRRQRPICSYPGLDVAAPSSDPAPGDAPVADGLDLAAWFRARE
jgi:hypothetical protein